MTTKQKSAPTATGTHKHLRLRNEFVRMLPDDDGNVRRVIGEHKAEFDVPIEDLEACLADARQRWTEIEVLDECPEHCPAQLAKPPGA